MSTTLTRASGYAAKLGYLPINIGALVDLPKVEQVLGERILEVDSVVQMLAIEPNPRNKALLRLLYLGGLRISEVCGLKSRHLQPRDATGQVSVFGKGRKTRALLLKPSL